MINNCNQLQIVIFVEDSNNHVWLIDLINYLTSAEIRVILITWCDTGSIHSTLQTNSAVNAVSLNKNVFGLLSVARNTANDFYTGIYSLGHKPSILAFLFKILIRKPLTINYVQQTNYFEMMQESKVLWNRIKGFIHECISVFYFKHSNYIQSVSKDTLEKLLTIGIEKGRIIDIPLGISDSFQGWSEPIKVAGSETYSHYQPYILSIGRLAWEKNHLFTIEVFKAFLQEDNGFKLLIAGEGPHRAKLQQAVISQGLAEKVILLGFRTDVIALLEGCSLFVHSSLTEGYASVQMEARLMRKPIVSSAVGVALDMEESGDPFVATFRDFNHKDVSKLWTKVLSARETNPGRDWENPSDFYKIHKASEVYECLKRHFLQTST